MAFFRAIFFGALAAITGTLPWALLVSYNLKYGSAWPWAVPVTMVWLWVWWRYVRGEGWPKSTSEARRVAARVNKISDDVWAMAIMAGLAGLMTVVLYSAVLGRMIQMPQQKDIDPSQYPLVTVFFSVLMSSVVAGVVEEISFRGYMQGTLERRYGPVVAIGVTSLMFGFLHFTHPETTLRLMPFYAGIGVAYGLLAWLTNSVWPGIVIHAGGDVIGAFQLLFAGRSEWQVSKTPAPLIWQAGTDPEFWLAVVGTVLVGGAAVGAYVGLAKMRKSEKAA